MKKDERLNTKAAEANIGLNEKMNEDVSPAYLYNTHQLLKLTMAVFVKFVVKIQRPILT